MYMWNTGYLCLQYNKLCCTLKILCTVSTTTRLTTGTCTTIILLRLVHNTLACDVMRLELHIKRSEHASLCIGSQESNFFYSCIASMRLHALPVASHHRLNNYCEPAFTSTCIVTTCTTITTTNGTVLALCE